MSNQYILVIRPNTDSELWLIVEWDPDLSSVSECAKFRRLVGRLYRLWEIDSNVLCDVSDEFNSSRDDWPKSYKQE